MPDEAEYQPQNSIVQTVLMPDQLSSVALSGGRNIPHTYYLGPNNTVPFIRLENPAASKEISWGELITVQPGQQVNIRNTSHMPGDLQIQSGTVPAARPLRITVPVRCVTTLLPYTLGTAAGLPRAWNIAPEFACDTRTARRAWFVLRGARGGPFEYSADMGAAPPIGGDDYPYMSATITNFFQEHSRVLQNEWTDYTYKHTVEGTDLERATMIPLGLSESGNAMRLADIARVVAQIGMVNGIAPDPIITDSAAYLIEY